MKTPPGTSSRLFHDLARLAAAGLQLPDFLVLTEEPEGKFKWLDANLVGAAKHWEATSHDEVLLPEAVDLMKHIGIAMASVVSSFVGMHADAATPPRELRHMAWEMRRQVIGEWLGQTGVLELNAAARAWRYCPGPSGPPEDDTTAVWQAWEQIHTAPELHKLRQVLMQHMQQPPLPTQAVPAASG
ncbi:MAG: hypothetical protein ACXWC4_22120 [Telluria sp.]